MREAIFRCGILALASLSTFPMSTSERCFHFSHVGGMFSIVEQLRNEVHDVKVTRGVVLILIHFTCRILEYGKCIRVLKVGKGYGRWGICL